jgi:hypothetical protein
MPGIPQVDGSLNEDEGGAIKRGGDGTPCGTRNTHGRDHPLIVMSDDLRCRGRFGLPIGTRRA